MDEMKLNKTENVNETNGYEIQNGNEIARRESKEFSNDISIDEMQPNKIENVIINETNGHKIKSVTSNETNQQSENGNTSSMSKMNKREIEEFRSDEFDDLLVNALMEIEKQNEYQEKCKAEYKKENKKRKEQDIDKNKKKKKK